MLLGVRSWHARWFEAMMPFYRRTSLHAGRERRARQRERCRKNDGQAMLSFLTFISRRRPGRYDTFANILAKSHGKRVSLFRYGWPAT